MGSRRQTAAYKAAYHKSAKRAHQTSRFDDANADFIKSVRMKAHKGAFTKTGVYVLATSLDTSKPAHACFVVVTNGQPDVIYNVNDDNKGMQNNDGWDNRPGIRPLQTRSVAIHSQADIKFGACQLLSTAMYLKYQEMDNDVKFMKWAINAHITDILAQTINL